MIWDILENRGSAMKLEGRVAIVTGGGGGIGREIALAYAEEGANLVLADWVQSDMEAVAQEVRALGRKALTILTDVTVEEEVNQMVRKTVDQFGRVNILVNVAGGSFGTMFTPIRDLRLNDWRAVLDINLTGAFLCSKVVLKYMMEQKSGIIINITSGHGVRGRAGKAAYCAAKFGMEGLTQAMAMELTPFNIRVNALRPGGMTATPKVIMDFPNIPPGTMLQPQIMREVAVYLASDDSAGVTCQSVIAKEWYEDRAEARQVLERMDELPS